MHHLDPQCWHPLGDRVQETRIVVGIRGYTPSLRSESLDESSRQTCVTRRRRPSTDER
jgi:hypothetical protein